MDDQDDENALALAYAMQDDYEEGELDDQGDDEEYEDG